MGEKSIAMQSAEGVTAQGETSTALTLIRQEQINDVNSPTRFAWLEEKNILTMPAQANYLTRESKRKRDVLCIFCALCSEEPEFKRDSDVMQLSA